MRILSDEAQSSHSDAWFGQGDVKVDVARQWVLAPRWAAGRWGCGARSHPLVVTRKEVHRT